MTKLYYQETYLDEKKKRKKEEYKSDKFIEDSDEEYGGMDTFLKKEKAQHLWRPLITTPKGRMLTINATGTKSIADGKSPSGDSDHVESDDGIDTAPIVRPRPLGTLFLPPFRPPPLSRPSPVPSDSVVNE